jgi:hypothetical protein
MQRAVRILNEVENLKRELGQVRHSQSLEDFVEGNFDKAQRRLTAKQDELDQIVAQLKSFGQSTIVRRRPDET